MQVFNHHSSQVNITQKVPRQVELHNWSERLPPVGSVAMLPQAEPSGGRRSGRLPSRELHSGQDSNILPLVLRQTVVASDRVRGDHQRVVKLGTLRVFAALDPEGVGQAAAEIQLRGHVAVDVPGESRGGQTCDAGVAFHAAGGAQAGIKGSQGWIEEPERSPGCTGSTSRPGLVLFGHGTGGHHT